MTAGRRRIWIELRNKLGALIKTDQLIIIVEDPQKSSTATVARPRSSNPDQFAFAFDYKEPGTYQIRIFPPEHAALSSSTFTIPIVVGRRER
jgi:hypothetical protein